MSWRFIFMATWNPAFNVHKDFRTKIPTWIELPYRSLLLEENWQQLTRALEPILHFIQGDEYTFPHDKACILWDSLHRTYWWLKIWVDKGHAIWQEILFWNLPTSYRVCGSKKHPTCDYTRETIARSNTKHTGLQMRWPIIQVWTQLQPNLNIFVLLQLRS